MWARFTLFGTEVICITRGNIVSVYGRWLHTGAIERFSAEVFAAHFVNVTRANEIIGAERICAEPSQSALINV